MRMSLLAFPLDMALICNSVLVLGVLKAYTNIFVYQTNIWSIISIVPFSSF
ncbi:hypothetical protein Godav_004252, partial [Gossypium davidsonii]|nr:hypothetical protein [Gossypium davidsonii]